MHSFFRFWKWLLAATLLPLLLSARATAQTVEFLPEVDGYYKATSEVRLSFQAKETLEAEAPVTAEFGPSLDLYLKPMLRLSDITAFDLDDSKSRPLIVSIGYRYLPTPGSPPTNRFEPVVTGNFPIRKLHLLLSDRNRGDLDWQGGAFTWRYRNRVQLERNFAVHSYHFSPYASAEFYYESEYSKWTDTALYAGCLFPAGKHVQLNPYYEHQNVTGKSPNKQLNQLGFILSLFFAR
jgi:hypothetical protein